MAEHPILFSDAMVRAIMAGRKTQTRRVVKLPKVRAKPTSATHIAEVPYKWMFFGDGGYFWLNAPHSVGDTLWVRECWQLAGWNFDGWPYRIRYRSDGAVVERECTDEDDMWIARESERMCNLPGAIPPKHEDGAYDLSKCVIPWRPSTFMPRWASRLTLEVTGVRAQSLDEMTDEDAIAEGATSRDHTTSWGYTGELWRMDWEGHTSGEGYIAPKFGFDHYWNELNGGRPGASTRDNPWVWVYEFKVVPHAN